MAAEQLYYQILTKKYSMLQNAVIHGLSPYHLQDLDADVSTTQTDFRTGSNGRLF